jgi:uncharacterized protein
VRRIVLGIVVFTLAFSASATTRYVTDHVNGPVRWQEWGRGAIERAQKEKRPLFVSIGYAASWDVHRMHREAFLNGENAGALNAYFVPVLLDRIEYPEVAQAYEAVARAMTGAEGWPVNVILTPSLEPIVAGAFLSTAELHRMLVVNANRWAQERAAVMADVNANMSKARANADVRAPLDVDATTMEAVVDDIARTYDKTKTLDPMTIGFLFRYAARTKNEKIRSLAVSMLRKVGASTMRDQLGGGFHHCTTCYEKLLADQALFAMAYMDGWQIAHDPDLAHVARTTLDYVVRDLVPPTRGLFQSSQDAHSLIATQGRPVFAEGAFYWWTRDEITMLVGRDAAGKIIKLFGIGESKPTRPTLDDPRFLHESYDELAEPLQKLLTVRLKRPAPFRENGIASWNGLMISALARGAAVFGRPDYLDAAMLAATMASTKLWNAQKKTLVRNESQTPAIAEDYAMLVQGLLDLFESGYDPKWLQLAIALQQRQDQLFWDASTGRYTIGGSAPEVVRGLVKERDVETPGVNSIAAMNLLRLAALTGNESWRTRPAMIFQSFGGTLRNAGALHPQLAAAYELSLIAPSITIITGDLRKPETRDLLHATHERWEPMRAVVFLPIAKGAPRSRMLQALPFLGALASDPEHPVEYRCASAECRRQ